MSRGTARSISSSGRQFRAFLARRSALGSRITRGDAVADTTRSTRSSVSCAEGGLGADPLPRPDGGAEEVVGEAAGRARLEGLLEAAPHLALDLTLADDHRIEPGGDTKQVSRGVDARVDVDDVAETLGRAPRALGEPLEHGGLGGLDAVRRDVELGAVTRGERDALVDR